MTPKQADVQAFASSIAAELRRRGRYSDPVSADRQTHGLNLAADLVEARAAEWADVGAPFVAPEARDAHIAEQQRTIDALAAKCDRLEADREYNAGLVEERDAQLAALVSVVERIRTARAEMGECTAPEACDHWALMVAATCDALDELDAAPTEQGEKLALNTNDLDARVLDAIRGGARTWGAIRDALPDVPAPVLIDAADALEQRGSIVRRERNHFYAADEPPDLAARFAAWMERPEEEREGAIFALMARRVDMEFRADARDEAGERSGDLRSSVATLDALIALARGGTP